MKKIKNLVSEQEIIISIANIGKIEFASINITSHSCIVGINSTGKSTVLKVIYSMISSINQFSRLITNSRTKYNFINESELTTNGISELYGLISDRIKGILNIDKINNDSVICLYLNGEKTLEWNSNNIVYTGDILELNNIPKILYLSSPEVLTYSHLIYRGESTDTDYSTKFNYALPYDLEFIEYLATLAERNNINLPVNITEKGTTEILEDGKYHRPSVLGTGVKLLRILETLVKSNNENIIFLIDEPEVGCHPSMQRRICKILSQKFKYFTITTHSIYVVNNLSKNINYIRTKTGKMSKLIDVSREELLEIYTDQLIN